MPGAVSGFNHYGWGQAWSGVVAGSGDVASWTLTRVRFAIGITRYQASLGAIEDDGILVGFAFAPADSAPAAIDPSGANSAWAWVARPVITAVTDLATPGAGPPSPWTREHGVLDVAGGWPIGSGNTFWWGYCGIYQDSDHVEPVVGIGIELWGWST